MKVNYYTDTDKAKRAAADALNKIFNKYKKTPILFLISGGSSLSLLDSINVSNFNHLFTITVLDERYDHTLINSNFYQLSQTKLYSKIIEQGTNSIDTQTKANDTLQSLAQRFEQGLRQWKSNNPRGIVVATQGIGPDGHTAGVFPRLPNQSGASNFSNDDNHWVIGYQVNTQISSCAHRVTTTFTFLKKIIDYTIVYLEGENKRKVLQQLIETKDNNLLAFPAGILHYMKNVQIFTNIKID